MLPGLRRIDRAAVVPERQLALLGRIGMFAPLPRTDLERLASQLDRIAVPRGTEVPTSTAAAAAANAAAAIPNTTAASANATAAPTIGHASRRRVTNTTEAPAPTNDPTLQAVPMNPTPGSPSPSASSRTGR